MREPEETMRVHHIALVTPNVDGIAAFYRELLEVQETARHQDDQGLRSVWLDLDGVILMVERGQLGQGGWHMLSLAIEPGRRAYWAGRLKEHDAGPIGETGFTLYGQDPDGNAFGLSHYPEHAH
jgi:catechol 2,3-dioxygenase-like lactoylglutathione lyase family enzyme